MTSVRVNLGPRSYDIAVTSADLAGVGPFARGLAKGRLAFVVTDKHVLGHARAVAESLCGVDFNAEIVTLPAGEGQKALGVAGQLYDQLIELQADRKTLVVAVGGGVMGDLAGFVAATYARGLPLLMVPTTLLAMVDSSVGGKVAVNHPRAKNMIGAFHQPVGVWIDTATLNTLPEREFRSGLAEVAKYGVIMDAPFFAWLEENIADIVGQTSKSAQSRADLEVCPTRSQRQSDAIRYIVQRCCQLKADVVEKDEREETGLRAILNYGHTFAHAFETAAGYGAWLHGEAVAAGMMCAARLAVRRGLVGPELVQRQQNLLTAFGLPIVPHHWPIDGLLATMRTDKKAMSGQLRFILPTRLGEVSLFDDVPEADVREVLQELMC